MFRKKVRFAVGFAAIVAAILFFALSGFEEGKAYYRTLDELDDMGETALGKRLRVAGMVREGSIERRGGEMTFVLEQSELQLEVHYTGSRPVPDTFKDGVNAVVEGQQRPDGTFEADQIQAKCSSKYEAKYASGEQSPH